MIFDAKPNYDPENKDFPAVTEATPKKLTSRFWDCPQWLDQNGNHGCAVYASLHNLVTIDPVRRHFDPTWIQRFYLIVRQRDEFPGEAEEGTSVVACMTYLKRRALIGSYRHAFGLAQLKQTIAHIGPVVITCPWHYKMTQPDASGLVKVGGPVVGWHAMLVRGMRMENKRFALRQNAGKDYGDEGDIWITFEGMRNLLREGGTLCLARMK